MNVPSTSSTISRRADPPVSVAAHRSRQKNNWKTSEKMGSRDKDQTTTHHQPLLSSLVVRPSNSDGGGGGVGGTSGGRLGRGDYEPGEVSRDPPLYTRSDRYTDDLGYRIHAGSASPIRRRDTDHRYTSDFDHTGGLIRGREFGGGRDLGRYRDTSPHYNRRISGGRPFGRGFDGPGFAPGPYRGERMSKNNPNVRPREGDWYCSDPLCGNLNFARREFCNNCNRSRHGAGGSPRRGYVGPPTMHSPPRRFPAHPIERSPGRTLNGYRSPPRGWARDGPREIAAGGPPPPRYESRFPDHHLRRDRVDYQEDGFRGRSRFDRPIPADWSLRDNGRDGFINDRKGFERRPPSPPQLPLPPQRGRWARDVRERSRSPLRGPVRSPMRVSLRSPLSGGLPPKDFRRDIYEEREHDDRRGLGRDRVGGPF